jgi:MOSC domain-containing protein YiiM
MKIDGRILGHVASLHLHSDASEGLMVAVWSMELIAGKGIAGNKRYFGRPTRRQVTLIEREQIAEHAAVLGLESLPPGAVRSNVETEGVYFSLLKGKYIRIGKDSVVFLHASRTPCHKMDDIAPGLRELMENGRQGMLGQIVVSGVIQVGDAITLANPAALH